MAGAGFTTDGQMLRYAEAIGYRPSRKVGFLELEEFGLSEGVGV